MKLLIKQITLTFLISVILANNAFAFQNCQFKYDNDKRSLPSLRGMCNVCHISPNGGGPVNEFGDAYAKAGFMITDELVSKFQNLFGQSTSTPSPSETQTLLPFIRKIKPNVLKVNVQSMISIMGKNFAEGVKAFIDEHEVVTTFKSNMLLIIDFVLDTLGLHNLKVENPDGQESNTVKVKAK